MTMATLYEELFEGKHPRKCEDCMHYDACHEFSHIGEKDTETCEDYAEEGRTLYDDLYGRERELPDDLTVENE